jgi:hypothetical protein
MGTDIRISDRHSPRKKGEIMMGGWLRWYHGAVSDDKWPLIARKSGQTVAAVIAVWAALLECASQAETRGNIENFDAESIDALLHLPDGATQAVVDALSSGKRPRIVDGHIANWDKRQSKDEEAAERKRLQRERERLAGMSRDVTQNVTPCHGMSQDVTADVTPCHGMSRDVTADVTHCHGM